MLGEISSLRNIRHIDKTFYLGGDERFYEQNYAHYLPNDELLSLVKALIKDRKPAWTVHRADVWTHIVPDHVYEAAEDTPRQGWKIHVSATNLNCSDILVKVAELAVARDIQFKYANDVETLRLMTSKRWPRGGSGKFITVYPGSLDQFREFIETAYIELKGYAGSYILSDRRYRDSRCLYYRYGGIRPVRRMDYTGRKQEVLTSPDGEEVLDQRSAFFDLPHWVSDIYPEDQADQQEDLSLNNGRFAIKSALAFSNTGGVYLATDTRSGAEVIIKEARPGVELGISGDDATARLAREARLLGVVGGTGVSPQPYATFWDWENFYLVEEYLQGDDMRLVMLKNTPLLRVNATQADSANFYRIYKSVIVSLLTAIERFHAQGVVIGDLSPTNILFDDTTMTVRIIDLEGAYRPGMDSVQAIHTPGFRARTKGRPKENSFGDDLYAVGVIMMYSMFPIAALAYIRADVFSDVLPALIGDIGWSQTPVVSVIQRLITNSITCREAITQIDVEAVIEAPSDRGSGRKPIPPLAELSAGLARFITGTYRLDDLYTLFPVDPFGRHSNPLGFGFGATGVIHSLEQSGFEVPEMAMERYRRELDSVKPEDLPPGFINGAAGMAWGLLARGDLEAGRRFLDVANVSPLARSHYSLYYGMAGIGMANLAAFQMLDERRYLDKAIDFADTLAAAAIRTERGVHWSDHNRIRLGYGYGQSGVALFFLRLSQILDEPKWRTLGQAALEYDLSFGQEVEPGVVSFGDSPDDTRTLEQYIEQGSGGIAKVAIRYGMWDRIEGLLADMHRKYSGFPGLVYGLTGFIDVLTDAHIYSGDARYLEMAKRPLRGLVDLYLFETDDGLATPGENLFRISCDYATGMAGIMYTLHRHDKLVPDELCLDSLDSPKGA